MINLGSWMNKVPHRMGCRTRKIANTFDEAIIAILLVAVAIGLDYLCQAIFVGGVRSIVKHTHYKWDTLLIKRKVVTLSRTYDSGILVYALVPDGFYPRKGIIIHFPEDLRGLYHIFPAVSAQRSSLNDVGFV